MSVCRQAVEESRTLNWGRAVPKPPSIEDCMASGSRSQRDSRSGRGLPIRILSPCVQKKANACESPRPSHAEFHSHNLRLILETSGLPGVLFDLGGSNIDTQKVMTAGTASPTMIKTADETFSFSTNGYEISGSTGEKGLWFGLFLLKTPPKPAMTLGLY